MSSKSKQSLKVDNNQKFPNNNTGFITPDKLRSFNEDVIDSFVTNDYTQSVDNTITDVSQSFNQFTSSYYTDSASFDARLDAVDTSSYVTQTEFLNNSASVDTRFIGIEAETASLQSQIDNITFDTGSLVTTQSFNDYTQSTDSRLDSIETTTASLQSQIDTKLDSSSFNAYTQSTDSRLDNIEGLTGSLYETASNDFSEITLTKVDGTTDVLDTTPRQVWESVKNGNGQTIQKGTPVYASGSVGNAQLVFPASASDATTMPAVYILAQNLDPDEEGYGYTHGFINGVNTSLFAAGDPVYVGVDGGFTNQKPTGSANLIQKLGTVVRSDASNGSGVIQIDSVESLPNIQEGYAWVGDSDGVPQSVATSSFGGGTIDTSSLVTTASFNSYTESADSRLNNIELATGSYATTGSNTFTQTQTLEQDLVVQGNLYVSGAEVIISSSELIVGDRIIEINANKVIGDAGIYAFDAIGDQTGSLIWNPTLDYWLAGLSGSEEKILVSSDTASLETSVNALNSYTQSTDLRLNSIESATGSYATTGSNTFTGNQIIDNSAPTFQLGESGNEKDTGFYDINVNRTTSSNSAGFRIITPDGLNGIQYQYSPSLETSGSGKLFFNGVGVFGAPNGQVTLFETTHASQDFIVSGTLDVLTTFTAPLTQGNVWVGNSGGTNTQIPTSSFETDLTSLNSYTQSTDLRLNNIELTTQSFDGRLNNIELTTQSFDGRLDNLELTTASFETKFNTIGTQTGSYATTGSNTFIGGQIISGNLDLEETFTASLQEGYVWVGDVNGRTYEVSTGSFGGGGGAAFPYDGDAQISGSLGVTGSMSGYVNALSIVSNTASVDFNDGNLFTLTLASSADTHINPTNVKAGQTINIQLTQPATTGSISFAPSVKFAGGYPFVATTTGSAVDMITLVSYDGTDVLAVGIKNFL